MYSKYKFSRADFASCQAEAKQFFFIFVIIQKTKKSRSTKQWAQVSLKSVVVEGRTLVPKGAWGGHDDLHG